jgi:hypothetical protein
MSAGSAVTLDGKVQKIVRSIDPRIPDKAEIAVEAADELYREIRIANILTDENGRKVELKQGAHVDVTVEAEPSETTPKVN